MQTLLKMDKVVIEDYRHVVLINENMYWMKLTHLLSKKISKPQRPLLYVEL